MKLSVQVQLEGNTQHLHNNTVLCSNPQTAIYRKNATPISEVILGIFGLLFQDVVLSRKQIFENFSKPEWQLRFAARSFVGIAALCPQQQAKTTSIFWF